MIKAHDVRTLRKCVHCPGIGLEREMIVTHAGLMHGRCAFETLGIDAVEKLPATERSKFRLCDIGAEAMIRLLEVPKRRAAKIAKRK